MQLIQLCMRIPRYKFLNQKHKEIALQIYYNMTSPKRLPKASHSRLQKCPGMEPKSCPEMSQNWGNACFHRGRYFTKVFSENLSVEVPISKEMKESEDFLALTLTGSATATAQT